MISHVETGCLLPFFQSLIAGIFVGFIVAGLAFRMDLHDPWTIGVIVGSAAALWMFVGGIRLWRLDTYAVPDYMLPEPEPVQATSSTVRVEVQNGSQITISELGVPAPKLTKLAVGLLSGTPFTEAAWTGSDRPLTRSQFQHVRAEFIARGWLRWRSEEYPNQGCELSPAGKAVCRELVRQ